ncbi:hypothetical protein M413DRAFT_71191, partial [Hebeloma cylindrosporum]
DNMSSGDFEKDVPRADDIKIQYHPHSKEPPHIYHFEDYKSNFTSDTPIPIDPQPWKPFRTRLDFEFAEFMLDAHLNESQSASLISLVQNCISDPAAFTFKDGQDLKRCWKHARDTKASGFTTMTVDVPYKDNEITFDLAYRPIWEGFCLPILENSEIMKTFKWHAERHYKFNGQLSKWQRFIDEPWTADAMWDFQVLNNIPFCLILYADKTRLSSFGTAKGYPVMAHCGNLPVDTRNGEGVGGGLVVSFLPIVAEDAGETGKKGFVNFKRVVWHKTFWQILKDLEAIAKTGYYFKDGDILRWLFPLLLILSADYEEQYVQIQVYPCFLYI